MCVIFICIIFHFEAMRKHNDDYVAERRIMVMSMWTIVGAILIALVIFCIVG